MAGRWTFVLVIALACAMVTAEPQDELEHADHTAQQQTKVKKDARPSPFGSFSENEAPWTEGMNAAKPDEIARSYKLYKLAFRSKEEKKAFWASFNQFDKNLDKKVSQEEVLTYLTQQKGFLTDLFDLTQKMPFWESFYRADENVDKKVSPEEFLTYAKLLEQNDGEEIAFWAGVSFNQFDKNLDRKVSQEEFFTYLTQQKGFLTHLTYLTKNMAFWAPFNQLDENLDKKVSPEEFWTYFLWEQGQNAKGRKRSEQTDVQV